MRFSLILEGREGMTWAQWLGVTEAAERLGFEALFTSDHYLSVQGSRERGSSDAWTILAGLAARTSSIRLGTLVSPVAFREPAVLAKSATTVDHISGGPVVGMGAGWWEEEHATQGFPFPSVAKRFERLQEQLAIIDGLLTQDRYTFQGKHYRLESAPSRPKPVQWPRMPIILGGSTVGPWMQRLVASSADEFNTAGGSPKQVRERFVRARRAVERQGRAQETLTTSFMTWCFVGRIEGEWRDRVERARQRDPDAEPFGSYLGDLEADCIVGTPDRAAARLREYAEAGVQRVMLNHELFHDLDMLEVLAAEVLPRVTA